MSQDLQTGVNIEFQFFGGVTELSGLCECGAIGKLENFCKGVEVHLGVC